MDQTVLDHFFQTDPLIYQVLVDRQDELPIIRKQVDPNIFFHKLCDDIISQQLSGRVAEVIFDRFTSLFPSGQITAEALAALPDQAIRDIGASWAKVKYLKDLGLKTVAQEINYQGLPEMTDEEVIGELSKVKGIGRWTAEMFLIFTLGREDVFSFGDLGLKKGFQKLYQSQLQTLAGLSNEKRLVEEMKKVTLRWSPYRSFGALALWRHLDNR